MASRRKDYWFALYSQKFMHAKNYAYYLYKPIFLENSKALILFGKTVAFTFFRIFFEKKSLKREKTVYFFSLKL